MGRPYADKGVADLERLVEANLSDERVIAEIVAELRRRTVPKAKKLLARLASESDAPLSGSKKSTAKPAKGKPEKESPKSEDSGPIIDAAPSTTTPATDRSLEQAFELLRETFTLDAEILARWGMTAAMPDDLRKLVIAEWRKVLKAGADDRGRSVEMLEIDLAKLASHEGSEF